jgi:hypothetical protein
MYTYIKSLNLLLRPRSVVHNNWRWTCCQARSCCGGRCWAAGCTLHGGGAQAPAAAASAATGAPTTSSSRSAIRRRDSRRQQPQQRHSHQRRSQMPTSLLSSMVSRRSRMRWWRQLPSPAPTVPGGPHAAKPRAAARAAAAQVLVTPPTPQLALPLQQPAAARFSIQNSRTSSSRQPPWMLRLHQTAQLLPWMPARMPQRPQHRMRRPPLQGGQCRRWCVSSSGPPQCWMRSWLACRPIQRPDRWAGWPLGSCPPPSALADVNLTIAKCLCGTSH